MLPREKTTVLAAVALFALGCGEGPAGLTPPSERPVIETAGGPAIADELVVGLIAGTPAGAAEELFAALGGEPVWRAPRTGMYLVRFADATAARSALEALRHEPTVAEVTRSWLAIGTGVGTTPGLMEQQWNLPALSLDPYRDPGSADGVVIGVLDSGVAYESHSDSSGSYALAPDLAGASFGAGYDFINNDEHANDDNGHGTHMTGVIAAEGGITSLAAGATILPVKVLDSNLVGTELTLAEGLLFAAESGADVINLSLAFSQNYYPSRFMLRAVEEVSRRGVVMVAASGNNGAVGVPFPAAFREVIAVGASAIDGGSSAGGGPARRNHWRGVDRALMAAGYSNHGYLIDILAPGGSIDADVDGDGIPEGIVAQSFSGDPREFEYQVVAGTSPAAAQVTAIVAGSLAVNGAMGAELARSLLAAGADNGLGHPAELAIDQGRGFADGHWTMNHAASPPGPVGNAPELAVGVRTAFEEDGGGTRLRALVQVLDDSGEPVAGATVYGSFVLGAIEPQVALTDALGRALFRSQPRTGPLRIGGFQVEAVAIGRELVRPAPALLTDSCSLAALAEAVDASRTGPLALVRGAAAELISFSPGVAVVPTSLQVDSDWLVGVYGEELSMAAVGDDDVYVEVPDAGSDCITLAISGSSEATRASAVGGCGAGCYAAGELFTAVAAGAAEEWSGANSNLTRAEFDQLVGAAVGYRQLRAAEGASALRAVQSLLSATGLGYLAAPEAAFSGGAGVVALPE